MKNKDVFLENDETISEEIFDPSKVNLAELRKIDVRTVDINTLVDLKDIVIDRSLPKEQRMAEYIRQVKNPYCFRVGKVAVSVGFAENGPTFEELMLHYIETL